MPGVMCARTGRMSHLCAMIVDVDNYLIGFDIETDTTINGLDPGVAEITSIAVWSPDVQTVFDQGDERGRIAGFLELLDELPPGIACSWNGCCFDGPFIESRARLVGLETGFDIVLDHRIVPKYSFLPGWDAAARLRLRGHRHADVAYAYRDYALSTPALGEKRWGLKYVAESLGIEMIRIDASQMHRYSAETRHEYNLSDSRGTYLLGAALGDGIEPWVDRLLPAA